MSLYDQSTQILIEMNSECEALGERFGTNSKIYLTRRKQIDTLLDMQSLALTEITEKTKAIEGWRHALNLAEINGRARDIAEQALVESLAAKIHTSEIMDYLLLMKP